jgi:hypothetical protein
MNPYSRSWTIVLASAALGYFSLLGADAQDAVSGDRSVEEIYVVRSFRESRVEVTQFCAAERIGFSDATREDTYTFRSVAVSATCGLVTDADVAKVGTLHACVGPVTSANVYAFYADGVLNSVSFSGRGECVITEREHPESGLTVARCFLRLGQLPEPYVGGQLTTNTMSSRTVSGPSDPPGYTQPSIATVRLWKRRE